MSITSANARRRLTSRRVWISWFVTGMAWINRTRLKSRSGLSSFGSRRLLHAAASRRSSSWLRLHDSRTTRTETTPWDRPSSREERERLARCPVVQLHRRPRRSLRTSGLLTSRYWRTFAQGVYPESNRRADGSNSGNRKQGSCRGSVLADRGRHPRLKLPSRWLSADTTAVGLRTERFDPVRGCWYGQ